MIEHKFTIKDIVMATKTVSLEFIHNLEPKEHVDFEKGVEDSLWRICRMKIPYHYHKYTTQPNGYEKESILDNFYLCGMIKTCEYLNSRYTMYSFKRIHPENNLEFVLCTSLRRISFDSHKLYFQ